jgi:hypothetical protein
MQQDELEKEFLETAAGECGRKRIYLVTATKGDRIKII